MFTLFFGGNDFARRPASTASRYRSISSATTSRPSCQLARRLRDLPYVVGYDTLNEPLRGYLGWRDLRVAGGMVKVGACPSPFEAMLLGEGYPQAIEHWAASPFGFRRRGKRVVNPERARAWRPGFDCVWRRNGVWDVGSDGEPRLLRPDHFAPREGQALDFSQAHFLPFARRFSEAIRSVHPGAAIFVESAPQQPPPRWDAPGLVHAPHWYDGFVLFLGRYSAWVAVDNRTSRLVLTPWRIRRCFASQLDALRREASGRLAGAPTLLGEFGIAFDLGGGRAFRDGDFRLQAKAMDRTLRALDDTLMSGTLWNYTADNSNAHGDQWNGEDLSIFSRDQQRDPGDVHSGGRALEAVVRPYARAVAGEPLRMHFDRRRRRFELEFRHDPKVSAPTEIFVPEYQYPRGYEVTVSDGSTEASPETQTLAYRPGTERETHTLRIRPRSAPGGSR